MAILHCEPPVMAVVRYARERRGRGGERPIQRNSKHLNGHIRKQIEPKCALGATHGRLVTEISATRTMLLGTRPIQNETVPMLLLNAPEGGKPKENIPETKLKNLLKSKNIVARYVILLSEKINSTPTISFR